jgi:hypothetical protein
MITSVPIMIPIITSGAQSGGIVTAMISTIGLFAIITMCILAFLDSTTDRNMIVVPVLFGLLGGVVVAVLFNCMLAYIIAVIGYGILGGLAYIFLYILERYNI